MLYEKLWQTFPYLLSSSRIACSERSKNNSIIFSSSMASSPPFRLLLYTTVLISKTTVFQNLCCKNYTISFVSALTDISKSWHNLYWNISLSRSFPILIHENTLKMMASQNYPFAQGACFNNFDNQVRFWHYTCFSITFVKVKINLSICFSVRLQLT